MKHVLITGSNAGLGLDTATLLAESTDVEKITLAVRSQSKGDGAIAEVVAATGRPASMFDVLVLQIGDFASAKAAAGKVGSPVDGLVLNAGGMFGGLTTNDDGVVTMFAVNTVGHAVFVEELIALGKLADGARVMFSGSFASRGMPLLGLKGTFFPEATADCVDSYITGDDKDMKTPEDVYGYSKGLMVLYASALARKQPNYTFYTVSPGACTGTSGADTAPFYIRFILKYVAPLILVPMGVMHRMRDGSQRFVDALHPSDFPSGSFLASAKDKATGKVEDNRLIYPQYSDEAFQDAAWEAMHRHMPSVSAWAKDGASK